MSTKVFKNRFDITLIEEINDELISWLGESYHLIEN